MAFGDKAKHAPLRLVRGSAGENPGPGRPALSDPELVAAVQAGDIKVASLLCDRLWPQVDRTIRRLLGRVDSDHEDIAQIALMEIVNTIGRYRGDCSLDRWAQTVTAHAVFKHLRRRTIERRVFTALVAEDDHASPFHLGERAISRQLLGRIALGYDLHEIAEMTGASVAAAQSRLSRGRRELHARIAGDRELADLMDENGGPA
jgi:RNA polymerase sigma-70 factor (ECF subfamily)